ncbi:PREDICTED: probable RNA-binding protein 19 isoform X2 [Amphimedon queenslandica]|uniref:RRM domain-containing protein n=1 Tax=Amphimedon queenslandica TaxID=400682 RepID=A0AAN0JN19_AMPQE|nr:PREDICTED: probable RNA-binding protein 19 isoform X2 [Amphimedon queenslandica]|eukprot:XP_019858174.1 PREDICTED: probable RNA-binding protein 19 isoform X2 [Amphimedon queenslandica]
MRTHPRAPTCSFKMSSRVIVKNLPSKATSKELKEHFSKCGQITDVKLMYTRSGTFRRFAFVGYSDSFSAQESIKYFNNTYIGTSKIQVIEAKSFGDSSIPRPWSRYSTGSSTNQIYEKKRKSTKDSSIEEEGQKEKEEGRKSKRLKLNEDFHQSQLASLINELEELKSEPGFMEFLVANERGRSSETWSNEGKGGSENDKKKKKRKEVEIDEDETNNSRVPSSVSDLEFLKSKVVEHVTDETREEEREEESEPPPPLHTIRMRGLPYDASEKHVHKFFSPIQLSNIRLLKDDRERCSGLAFVDVMSETDLKEAMKRNKGRMGRRYIELVVDTGSKEKTVKEKSKRPWEEKEDEETVESIADSGRIFIRNLPYTTTEEELTELFEEYGQLSEINLLVDKSTGSSIGLGYVTFMFPEHAVKAFSELDGQVFQGRLLHLLPSKPPNKEVGVVKSIEPETQSSSFKSKQKEKLKSEAGSSHNWNTLFLGSNAVADSTADQFGVRKSELLDLDTTQSLAVRLALGETQLVNETREFLESHGVKLNSFDTEENELTRKRSKNVILVKNLPFGTSTKELTELFAPFGSLSRVILPPAGISALVEYSSSSNAKVAFKKLSYCEFKHLPLYLEWAPFGVMSGEPSQPVKDTGKAEESSSIFVKNLNFSTTDDGLSSHFKERVGGVVSAKVSKKYTPKAGGGASLSMGFGFVTFSSKTAALKALKELQSSLLDGHKLELQLSHSAPSVSDAASATSHKVTKSLMPKGPKNKILIRNVPFEASRKELSQLLSTFGKIKNLRLPKKQNEPNSHRGFCFVEYSTTEDARSAFESLADSTHLYGRRLVLEWAEGDDTVDDIRAKTALRFYKGEEGPEKKKSKRITISDNDID